VRFAAILPGILVLGAWAAGGEVSFTAKPKAVRVNGKVKITFAVSAPTDVAVYVENARGEVIRHLVAGVLGKNPPPPLKPGLNQSIDWDRKADYGQRAAGGPFKVRVALGLDVKYDRVVHEFPPSLAKTKVLAVSPDGHVYADGGSVFDRDGKLYGTWSAPHGEEAARYYGWAFPDGRPDPMRYRRIKYMNAGRVFTGNGTSGSGAVAVGHDGNDLFQVGTAGAACIFRHSLTAAVPKDSKYVIKLPAARVQDPCLAVSSDGASLYVGGLLGPDKKPLAAVYVVKCPERTGCRPFFGDPAKAGNDKRSLGGAPTGLAVDGKGRLFVVDGANGRIVVVEEKSGRYLGELAAPKPLRVGISTRSGAVYVLSSAGKKQRTLMRFSPPTAADPKGWKRLQPSAKLSVRGSGGYLAVDDSASPPVVWISGATVRVEDPGTGARFRSVRSNFPAADRGPKGYSGFMGPFANLVVDRLRKEVYFGIGANARNQMRYSEPADKLEMVTLQCINSVAGAGLQVSPAPNGNLYGIMWQGHFFRWKRNGKFLAWDEPRRLTAEELKAGKRPGSVTPEMAAELAKKGITVDPKCIRNDSDARKPPYEAFRPVGMCVQPHTLAVRWSDGHLFGIEPFRWNGQSVGGRTLKALHEYLPGGKRVTGADSPLIWKLSDAAVGPRFDAAGNIYIAEAVRPQDWAVPPEMIEYYEKKGVKAELTGKRGGYYTGYKAPLYLAAEMYGSIVKFSPKGGMVHWDARIKKGPNACGFEPFLGEPKLPEGLPKTKVEYGGQYLRYVDVTGAEWVHPGIGHVGFFGCNCENITFDVDEFGRSFFPDTPFFRVRAVDTAGNSIVSFGGYGDRFHTGPEGPLADPGTGRFRLRRPEDSKDLKSPYSEPDLAFSWLVGVGVTDRYVYMADSRNLRVLRGRMVYDAEETCAIGVGPARSAALKTSDSSDTSDRSEAFEVPRTSKPTPTRPTRSPEQICTGWFSAAKNYRRIGMKADAKRCLGNIVRNYPDTKWAARARQELARL
jgi:hypothetical protein